MRALVSGLVLAVLCAAAATAAPCVVNPLTTYISLGGTGCDLGPFTIKDFNFSVVTSGGGATPIGASSITVTPLTAPLSYGFSFSSSGFSVTGEQSVTYLLEYFWDPGPIRSLEDVLFAESPVAPGRAIVATTACLDAPFDFGVCLTTPVFSTVFHYGAGNTYLSDTVDFPTVYLLGIRHEIILEANGASSDFSSFQSSVLLTPEPAWLLPGGLLLLAGLRRLRR